MTKGTKMTRDVIDKLEHEVVRLVKGKIRIITCEIEELAHRVEFSGFRTKERAIHLRLDDLATACNRLREALQSEGT